MTTAHEILSFADSIPLGRIVVTGSLAKWEWPDGRVTYTITDFRPTGRQSDVFLDPSDEPLTNALVPHLKGKIGGRGCDPESVVVVGRLTRDSEQRLVLQTVNTVLIVGDKKIIYLLRKRGKFSARKLAVY